MPTQAFLNLPIEKQKRLINAAKIEFSNNLFEDASINKIIKSIDMPRGTFYLYFENKEDIYDYIFEKYKDNTTKIFTEILIENKGNIFDAYIKLFDKVTDELEEDTKFLINNFFINMNTRRIEKSLPQKRKGFCQKSEIIDNIDMDLLILDKDEIYTLISILMPLFYQNVGHSFIHPEQKEHIKEHYVKQINIIRKGIERGEKC